MPATSANPRRKRGRPPVEHLEEQRRSQIVAAAVTVFAERGYEATTMSDIARRAGIGQGTVYRYVASKRELLDLVFDYSVEEILSAVRPVLFTEAPLAGPDDIVARFDAALAAVTAAIDRRPELTALVLVELGALDDELKLRLLGVEASIAAMTSGLLAEAAEAGLLRPGADPQVLGLLLTKLAIPGGLREVMGRPDGATRERYRAALVDFISHGVLAVGASE